ncbi:MAG: 7-carboxy-7-deazaguanine synthase QueE [Methanobrevibacter boviskoreani]|uniref:7-carboxy-7-deazaguanine synthase QueE n=1 Tax=Methanobrevibacter TaxID=2172 RepID=UPI0003348CB5|nr:MULTISPECIES: 7-carboxy-7-deazaguanine synthase QueE [Methanobrevibacter]AGN17438.1 radical SAM domain-containing protein [Methanobrevibacter sp. AbM4]MCI6930442.1 7-carboxy-7-deazaguanine synthase QueE [Methanobrevibacter boviskoreani]MDY5614774.1 7-carboxy-7-deazaguanine synthase QueE [Methanobrevibacter boviskoreani]
MLEAPIVEIFSSIQGEGLLVGRRQIFVRFAGCNLDCNYCDTEDSKSVKNGELKSVDYVVDRINSLKTEDLHSISFTGGEPLLYADFIRKVIDRIDTPSFLETNGTFPNEIKKLDNLDYVSLDIKLPEHFDGDYNNKIFDREIESVNILLENSIKVYCKIVLFPESGLDYVENLASRMSNEINDKDLVSVVIQPVSPISRWKNSKDLLFKFSQAIGKYMDVLTIPQLHKFLEIE